MTLPRKFNDKEKWCNQCKNALPLDDFNNNSARYGGKDVFCRDCRKELQKIYLRKIRYGVDNETYKEMLKAQDNKCAICKRVRKRIVIDHDHKTGVVRGILCDGCNIMLGHLDDDVKFLKSAIDYLSPLGGQNE